jgi:hypothetical protein
MPANNKEKIKLLQLEPNLVLLFSVIAIPVIVLGALLILGTVRSDMNRLVGEELLGGSAADTARYLDSYLLNKFTTVSIIAASSGLHDAVNESNRRYQGDPLVIQERLSAVDEEWIAQRGAVPLALAIVGGRASQYLRELTSLRKTYKEILLTDRFGALVAATNITTDYYQADEEWWRQAFGDGDLGALYVGDVTFDRSAGAYTIEVAVPLREKLGEDSTQVAGVLKALVGADELFSVVGSVERGQSGHALLVSTNDGTVIAGSAPDDSMQRRYPGFAQLQENMAQGRRSFVSQQGDDLWLAGFARMPQPSPAPMGDWVVVVQQLHGEIHAATRHATTSLIVFFAGIVAMIVVFSLYLHYRLVKPIREIDLREEMERLTEAESRSTN